MPNHPNRKPPPSGPERLTPAQLADTLRRAQITQARAAALCGCALRTMQQWLAGDRAMPLSASMLLMAQLVLRGMPAGLARPWLGDGTYAAFMNKPRTKMKLWLLCPADGLAKNDNPWVPWYDKAFGFVLRAGTETEARNMAHDEGGDENRGKTTAEPWKDAKYSTCVELLPEASAGVVMQDFR